MTKIVQHYLSTALLVTSEDYATPKSYIESYLSINNTDYQAVKNEQRHLFKQVDQIIIKAVSPALQRLEEYLSYAASYLFEKGKQIAHLYMNNDSSISKTLESVHFDFEQYLMSAQMEKLKAKTVEELFRVSLFLGGIRQLVTQAADLTQKLYEIAFPYYLIVGYEEQARDMISSSPDRDLDFDKLTQSVHQTFCNADFSMNIASIVEPLKEVMYD